VGRPGDRQDGPEPRRLARAGLRLAAAAALGPRRALAGRFRRRDTFASTRDYRIYDRLDDVPGALLERTDLVLEKFLPAVEDGLFHTHMYLFLGDGERCSRIGCADPVFKADDSTSVRLVEPHAEARAWREELGLDYGKIDYVVRDDEAILLDANKTTGSSTYIEEGALRAERRRQAAGLCGYFSGKAPL
jgi:hypothetical protein